MSATRQPSTLAVIPARLASTRLPRKVLRDIAGKPMLQWIVEAALAAPRLDRVVIATDSDEVIALAAQHGWEAMLTSPDLQSGSDRVHAVSRQIPSDIVVNIQGDEPMLRPTHIDALLAPFDRSGIDAQVTGDYRGVVRFLTSLQRSPNYYAVEGLSARPAGQSKGPKGALQVTLHIKTYFRAA